MIRGGDGGGPTSCGTTAKVAAEIDGAQHTEDPLQRWDDMERDNDLSVDGYRTLRFPAWLVRQHPELVARQIRRALRAAGYRA